MAAASKYKPAYCNEIIECLALGHSIAAFAGSIGVAASSVYKWINDFPEFAEAYAVAKAKAVLFWEKKLIDIAGTGKGNVTATIFGLKNRAASEWRDVQAVEHTGANGGPILSMQDRVKALTAFMAKTKKDGGE